MKNYSTAFSIYPNSQNYKFYSLNYNVKSEMKESNQDLNKYFIIPKNSQNYNFVTHPYKKPLDKNDILCFDVNYGLFSCSKPKIQGF